MYKVGLFNDSFPPTIDGVANAVVNYATVISKDLGKVVVEPQDPPFIVSLIKIVVPNIKVYNYHIVVNDEKSEIIVLL